MRERLYPYFHSTKVAGVSLTLLPDNGYNISCCILQKQKDTVIIEHQKSHVASLEELTVITGNLPVVLAIEGKGILLKKTAKADQQQALQLAMPGAKMKDFYLETWPAPAEEQWVSLARKQEIDALLEKFRASKIQVCSLLFGPFKLSSVMPFLGYAQDSSEVAIQTGYYHMQWQGQQILAIQKTEEQTNVTYQIGDDLVNAEVLLPYSLALDALMQPTSPESPWPMVSIQRNEFYEKRIFQKASIAALAVLLSLLGINTLLFSEAFTENEELRAQTTSYKSSLVQLQQLQQEVTAKGQIIQSLGMESHHRPAFYLDRLGASLPSKIQLTLLTAFPAEEEKFKKKQNLYFNAALIQVGGLCQNPAILNDWLISIEQLYWVDKIQGQQYHYDTRAESGVFEFLIVIK